MFTKITVALIFLSSLLYANTETDTLKETLKNAVETNKADILNNLSRAYWFISPNTSISYGNEALVYARKFGNKRQEADSLRTIGVAYQYLGDVNKAIDFNTNSLRICELSGYTQGISYVYNNLGTLQYEAGNYNLSLDYYMQGMM